MDSTIFLQTKVEPQEFFTQKAADIIKAAHLKTEDKNSTEIQNFVHNLFIQNNIDLATAITSLSDILSTYLMASDIETVRRLMNPNSTAIN